MTSTTPAAPPRDRASPPRPPSARSRSAKTRGGRCGAPPPIAGRWDSGRPGDGSRVTAASPPRGPWTRWAHSRARWRTPPSRSEEHTSELQSRGHLVCRLLLEKKKQKKKHPLLKKKKKKTKKN